MVAAAGNAEEHLAGPEAHDECSISVVRPVVVKSVGTAVILGRGEAESG